MFFVSTMALPCQTTTLQLHDNDISRTSLCPWTVTAVCDRFRLPRRMNNVTCLTSNPCSGLTSAKINCRPVVQVMPVKRLHNNSWIWSSERINVACVPVLACWQSERGGGISKNPTQCTNQQVLFFLFFFFGRGVVNSFPLFYLNVFGCFFFLLYFILVDLFFLWFVLYL